MSNEFPEGFVWGVATSSYQIEGAVDQGGRGPSIWDAFAAREGTILDGTDGAVACDHFHRYADDVALMRELGVGAYRFSLAWPRIMPSGAAGERNEAGLDFYDRLIDSVLAAGLTPYATLYHWDLPQALQDRGGWPSRDIVERFVEYAEVVTRRYGDRVKHWFTHNEPWCASMLGYMNGEHAPGLKDWPSALRAAHHILLSHGAAMPAIRANVAGASAGIVLNLTPGYAASHSPADADACRHFDGFFNRWFLDPLYGRGYPEDIVADYRRMGRLPNDGMAFVHDGDLDVIAAPTDALGINYYSRAILRDSDNSDGSPNGPRTHFEPPDEERTDMGWEVYPNGLYDTLMRLHEDYAVNQILVTENGAAYAEGPGADGRVRDRRRENYLRSHAAACLSAIRKGAPLTGYFAWSLLDNYEWAYGYTKRFGLVHVDFETQERTLKDSARWYSALVKENALPEGGGQ